MLFLSFGFLFSVVSAWPPGRGYTHRQWPHKNGADAAYFLDNDPHGSSIISLRVGKNGHLSDPVRTPSNGYGAIGTNLTGFPNIADSLMSQSSVVLSGNVSYPCSWVSLC